MMHNHYDRLQRRVSILILGLSLLSLAAVLTVLESSITFLPFLFVGVLGAIFANGTGAGGGAVFVPVFNFYGIESETIVATSFSIQCFGMVAGSLSWYFHYQKSKSLNSDWKEYSKIIFVTGLSAFLTVFFNYYWNNSTFVNTEHYFSLFSILMGSIILLSKRLKLVVNPRATKLTRIDVVALFLIGILGGIITSYISIGVGEMLAVYLILRGFSVSLSIATAVTVSAIAVWGGVYQHWYTNPVYSMDILQFAIPGALIGGYVASHIVSRITPQTVKTIFAYWILISGCVLLIIN